jgi:hypothetical protein
VEIFPRGKAIVQQQKQRDAILNHKKMFFSLSKIVTYQIALKAQRLPLIASCSEMGSRTITAIIISGYSFVTDTLAASTTASRKFSFVHNIF